MLVLFRLTNPSTELRVAGGREVNLRSMQAMALYAANSMFVSDYLTTKGQSAEDDFRMIQDLGFEVTAGDFESSQLMQAWNQPHTSALETTAPGTTAPGTTCMTSAAGGCGGVTCGSTSPHLEGA